MPDQSNDNHQMPVGAAFECLSIPIEITKKEVLDSNNQPVLDETGKPTYFCGFSIGGGIDQDHNLSPQKYPDNGIYVTAIKPDGPAAASDLAINDKVLQVNGYDFTLVTHKKAVEYIKKGKTLNMLVARKPAASEPAATADEQAPSA